MGTVRAAAGRAGSPARVYAYDFAANSIPGLQEHEEPGYWRDVGTPSSLPMTCHINRHRFVL